MCSRSGIVVDEKLDVERVPTERVRRDLPVEDLRGDVGVVRCDLTPALRSVVGLYADEGNVRVTEGLDALDLHSTSKTITLRRVAPSPTARDRLVDLLERVASGDQLVELEPPAPVEIDEGGHRDPEPRGAHVAAQDPLSVAGEVDGDDAEGGAGGRQADDDEGAASAEEAESLLDRLGRADRDEDVVGAAPSREGAHLRRRVARRGIEGVGGAEGGRGLELGRRESRATIGCAPRDECSLHAVEADAARADDDDARADGDFAQSRRPRPVP